MTDHRAGRRPAPLRARAGRWASVALVAAALLGLAACGDDAGGDRTTFCAAVEALRSEDPFAELEVASPGQMRDAFEALADGADRIAGAAPGEVSVQADRYRDAVGALRDELAGAGYDPTRMDGRRYARAVADYTEAADSLDNAADARC